MAFYELRKYKIRRGKMNDWLRLMEGEIIPFQVSKGMVITGSFRGEADDSVYIWLRRFNSEKERKRLYQAVYEVVAAGKVNDAPTEKVTIAGKYCESGDLLASDIMMPELVAGDVLAIPAAGAYCPSMASNYNLNPRPPMVLVNNGQSRLIRRRESYQDMMHCDVI